jgi:membrane dipeptidase
MNNIPYFDGHCDTVSAIFQDGRSLRRNRGHLDLTRLGAFSKSVQIFALYADSAALAPGTVWAHTQALHDIFISQLSDNSDICVFCKTRSDIENAHAARLTAALLSIEGGELLNCDPALLETVKAWGVQSINLTWNHQNALSGSHSQCPDQGLTHQGRAFVGEMNRLHLIPDVSHLSDSGFWDVAETAASPLFASHSNARSLCPHSRNLTDDMFRAICQTGGVAGINFYVPFVGGDGSLEAVADHIDHWMALDGAKHIALGGDWDGCDRLAGDMTGVEALPRLWDVLARRGYDRATLEDIYYNNLARLLPPC